MFHSKILVRGVEKRGKSKKIGHQKIIARMLARMSDSQKLRQKSQAKSLENTPGAFIIILSRIPNLSNNKIIKAEKKATHTLNASQAFIMA